MTAAMTTGFPSSALPLCCRELTYMVLHMCKTKTAPQNTSGAYQLLHLQPWVQGVAHVGQVAIFTVQAVHAAEGG